MTSNWQDISNYFILIFKMSFASCSFTAALLLSIIAYLACVFYNKNVFLSTAGHWEVAFCQWQHNSRPQVDASYRLNVTNHAWTRESQRCFLILNVFGFIVWWKHSVPNSCSVKMFSVSVSFMSSCLVLCLCVCVCVVIDGNQLV